MAIRQKFTVISTERQESCPHCACLYYTKRSWSLSGWNVDFVDSQKRLRSLVKEDDTATACPRCGMIPVVGNRAERARDGWYIISALFLLLGCWISFDSQRAAQKLGLLAAFGVASATFSYLLVFRRFDYNSPAMAARRREWPNPDGRWFASKFASPGFGFLTPFGLGAYAVLVYSVLASAPLLFLLVAAIHFLCVLAMRERAFGGVTADNASFLEPTRTSLRGHELAYNGQDWFCRLCSERRKRVSGFREFACNRGATPLATSSTRTEAREGEMSVGEHRIELHSRRWICEGCKEARSKPTAFLDFPCTQPSVSEYEGNLRA
jgi:hypothetical protein